MNNPLVANVRKPLLLELRLWRQFVAVAEELHFSRAALKLNMTQPPLTQAIAQLETALGLKLFDRTKRSVQLTVVGAALVPEARDLLARAAALPVFARASADGELGRLRLAFVSTVGFDLLPRWIRTFREQHPKVQLELIEATGDVQLEALARGEIDAGLILHSPGFAPPGLTCQRIARNPLIVAVAEQSELADSLTFTLKDLLDQPLVIFPRRILPSLYDAIFALYRAAGYLPRVAQEAIQMQTIVNLVSAGIGVAWVPDSVRQFQRPGVVYRELTDGQEWAVPSCETSLVWATQAVNPALLRFMAFAPDAYS